MHLHIPSSTCAQCTLLRTDEQNIAWWVAIKNNNRIKESEFKKRLYILHVKKTRGTIVAHTSKEQNITEITIGRIHIPQQSRGLLANEENCNHQDMVGLEVGTLMDWMCRFTIPHSSYPKITSPRRLISNADFDELLKMGHCSFIHLFFPIYAQWIDSSCNKLLHESM